MADIDPTELDQTVESFIVDMGVARAIAQGGVNATVETENGPVDSLAKTVNDLKVSFEAGVGGIFDTVVGGYARVAKDARDESESIRATVVEAGQEATETLDAVSQAAAGTVERADQVAVDASAVSEAKQAIDLAATDVNEKSATAAAAAATASAKADQVSLHVQEAQNAATLAGANLAAALAAGRIKDSLAQGMTDVISTTLPDSVFWVRPYGPDGFTAFSAFMRVGAGPTAYAALGRVTSPEEVAAVNSVVAAINDRFTSAEVGVGPYLRSWKDVNDLIALAIRSDNGTVEATFLSILETLAAKNATVSKLVSGTFSADFPTLAGVVHDSIPDDTLQPYARAWKDAGDRVALGILKSGVAEATFLSVLESLVGKSAAFATLTADAPTLAGVAHQVVEEDVLQLYARAWKDSSDQISEIAVLKNGRVPDWVLSAQASRVDVSILADRLHVLSGYDDVPAVRLASGEIKKMRSNRRLVVGWGDSLTAGVGGGGTTYLTALQANYVSAGYADVVFYNRGYAGRSGTDIAIYQGGVVPLVTVTGNQIPASGEVVVTAILPSTSWRYGTSGEFTWDCTLSGVAGQLVHDVSATTPAALFKFRRTAPGSAVACPPQSPVSITTGDSLVDAVSLFAYGRNNFSPLMKPMDVMRDTRASIARLAPVNPDFLVQSILTTTAETKGTAGYTNVMAVNDALADKFGDRYFDVRRYLVDHAVELITAAGGTVTTADTAAIAGDTIPPSLHDVGDAVHLNATGYTAWGAALFSTLQSKGWLPQ